MVSELLGRPVVTPLSSGTEVVLRLIRIERSSERSVTEEEVTTTIYEGAQVGVSEEPSKR